MPDSNVPKPKLVNNKLYIAGKVYTSANMHELPETLHPQYIYTPSRFGITAFFSNNSPLSNHYQIPGHPKKAQFVVGNDSYTSMEQYFMAEKAKEFNDVDAIRKIMAKSNPVEIKKFGTNIKGYKQKQWISACEDKLLIGLKAKFSQNSDLKTFLLSTGTNTLAEACTNNIWGIGKTLTSKDLFNKETWSGRNIMGQLLMQVRDGL